MNTSRQPFRTTLKQVKLKVNMKKATMPALTSMVKLKVSMKEATLTVASTSTSKSTILQVVLEAKAISAMTLEMEEWVLEVFIILEAVIEAVSSIDHLGPRLGESMSLTLKMEEASKLMPMKIKMEETMDGWMEETMAMKMKMERSKLMAMKVKMETSKLMAMKMKLERSKLMAMKMKMETSKTMAMKMKMERSKLMAMKIKMSKRKLRMKKALIGQIGTR